jgi:hypothetical protein
VPVENRPLADNAGQDEGVAADELLGRLTIGEDRHRAVFLCVGEGPDHEQVTAADELLPASPVRGPVDRR